MKRGTTTLLKIAILIIAFSVLCLCVFWLPWLANETAVMNPEYAYLKFPVLFGLYITTIPFYVALYEAFRLLIYIENENAFSDLAVLSLKHIKYCAMAILILYVVGIVLLALQNAVHPGIAIIGAVIIFATLVISLFAAVLQELLRSALIIKAENDLTV